MYDIIKKPVQSEKSVNALSSFNKYTFIVDKYSNKVSIKHSVEKIFNVNVEKINIMNVKGKKRKFKGRIGYTSDYKKAIVTLQPNNTIDYSGDIK